MIALVAYRECQLTYTSFTIRCVPCDFHDIITWLKDCVDHRCCDEAVAVLLLEEDFRITERSAGSDLITKDSSIIKHVFGSITKDFAHTRKPPGSRIVR